MELKDLSGEDRADFLRRVAKLDLDENLLETNVIEVDSGKSMRLEMTGEGPLKPLVLKTKDISVLRRWIGTPERASNVRLFSPIEGVLRQPGILKASKTATGKANRAGAKASRTKSAKTKKIGGGTAIDLEKIAGISGDALAVKAERFAKAPDEAKANFQLSSLEKETIRAAARELVHGDSESVMAFKPAVEAFFQDFVIAVWLSIKIVVKKNSTLTLGTGVHNLTAYEMVIEDGGRVRSFGHLNVNVTKLRSPGTRPSFELPSHVLSGPLRPIDF